jgi:hypothetical protein
MSLNHPYQSEGYVPAYQISAMPYVTSSNISLGQTRVIDFGYVSRFITIKNTGASTSVLSVAFTENGLKTSNSNYFYLSGSENYTGEIRTSKIFLSGTAGAPLFSVIAGLTTIPVAYMTPITGSNGYPGVG